MNIGHSRVQAYLNDHPLLAKWRVDDENFRPARGFTWEKHTREVLWGLDVLFTEPFFGGRWYDSIAHALHDKMGLGVGFEDLRRWALLAALGHDLGKCGGEFQQMLVSMELEYLDQTGPAPGYENPSEADPMRQHMKGFRRHKQMYRHEFLSALLMFHDPDVRKWFRDTAGSDEGLAYVIAGAFGHHIKGSEHRAFQQDLRLLRQRKNLPVYTDKVSRDMNTVLGEHLPSWSPVLSAFPSLERLGPDNHIAKIGAYTDRLDEMRESPLFQGELGRDLDDDNVSAAIKWLVILADTFGSIEATRERILCSVREIWKDPGLIGYEEHIQRRLALMGKTQGIPKPTLRPFQRKSKSKYKSLILESSTGGGKTLATFSWASGSPKYTLLFCSPTTDTATCLYEDYAASTDWLRHSKAWFDVTYRTTHEENTGRGKTPDEAAQDEGQEMLDLLRGSDRDVMFTTVDQVLGLVAFYRKSIGLLPYILKSQIAFDEVTSYDPTMLAFLDRFLTFLPGIRTAHLSATFPKALEDRLAKRIHQRNPPSPRHTEPRILRDSRRNGKPRMRKRFRVHVLKDAKEAAPKFEPGTLWFTNVVKRAQGIARAQPDTLCYHSRFKYEDRQKIRDRLVTDFHKPNPQAKVVTTQAAEMSLDISALRMISEVAPIASLIQRLGRVNRTGEYGIVDTYFYIPEQDNGLPYVTSRKEWAATYERWQDWLFQFQGKEVSQDDLEKAFQAFYARPENGTRDREVFSPRLQTYRHSVRDAIYTVPCLLDSDVKPSRDKGVGMSQSDIRRKTIPVALKPKERRELSASKALYRRVYVIDASYGAYDPRLGFLAA